MYFFSILALSEMEINNLSLEEAFKSVGLSTSVLVEWDWLNSCFVLKLTMHIIVLVTVGREEALKFEFPKTKGKHV